MNNPERELALACFSCDQKKVENLLKQGVSPNAQDEQQKTALMWASVQGHTGIVKMLLQFGANSNIATTGGDTALNLAERKGYAGIGRILKDFGSQSRSKLPLGVEQLIHDKKVLLTRTFNANDGDAELLEAMLQRGLNPNLDNGCGVTMLMSASFRGQVLLVRTLLRYKANPNAGGTNMIALVDAASKGYSEIIELLLKHGADIDAETDDGWNALSSAALGNHVEAVKTLIAHGADPNKKNRRGETALGWAVHGHCSEVVREMHTRHILPSKTLQVATAALNSQMPTTDRDEITSSSTANISEDKSANVNLITAEAAVLQLKTLIGLTHVKTEVTQLTNFLRFQKMRKEKGLSVPEQSLHMVFTGNPGTGKTTIARLIAQIYKSMGILSKGQFVETDRAGLVGGYLGQTAIKTQEVVESALGGVLFIDEAYSLTDSTHGHDLYGQEAVATLLKMMEDHRDDLIVIVAGYTEPMEKFIRSNPGLQSRFNKFLHFDDYAPAELTEIFGYFAAQGDYKLHPATELKLHNVFADLYAARDETFGNARLARNLFEKAINAHANRMVSAGMVDEVSLVTLYPEDVPNG